MTIAFDSVYFADFENICHKSDLFFEKIEKIKQKVNCVLRALLDQTVDSAKVDGHAYRIGEYSCFKGSSDLQFAFWHLTYKLVDGRLDIVAQFPALRRNSVY